MSTGSNVIVQQPKPTPITMIIDPETGAVVDSVEPIMSKNNYSKKYRK